MVWVTIGSFLIPPIALADDQKVPPIIGLTPGTTDTRNYTEQTNDTCSLNGRKIEISGDNSGATILVPLSALAAARIPGEQSATLKPVRQETGKVLFASSRPFWQEEINVQSSFWKKVTNTTLSSFLTAFSRLSPISYLNNRTIGSLSDSEAKKLMQDIKDKGSITIEAYAGTELKDTFPTVPYANLTVQYKVTINIDGKEDVAWGIKPSEDFIKVLQDTGWWANSGSCRFLVNPSDFERILAAAGADIDGDGKPDGTGLTGVEKGETSTTNLPSTSDVSTESADECSFSGFNKLPEFILNCIVKTFTLKMGQWIFQLTLQIAGAPPEVVTSLTGNST